LFLFDQVGHFLALAGKFFDERQCITGALLSLLVNHQSLYRKHAITVKLDFSASKGGARPKRGRENVMFPPDTVRPGE
jgi:hypothetical protein